MAQSFNDLQSGALKRVAIAAGTSNAVLTGAHRIHKVIVTGGSGATGVLQMYNALTVTGSDIVTITAVTASGATALDLSPLGTVFSTGLTTVLTGAGSLAQVFYTAE
jgi:precorrin-6B methylase 2